MNEAESYLLTVEHSLLEDEVRMALAINLLAGSDPDSPAGRAYAVLIGKAVA